VNFLAQLLHFLGKWKRSSEFGRWCWAERFVGFKGTADGHRLRRAHGQYTLTDVRGGRDGRRGDTSVAGSGAATDERLRGLGRWDACRVVALDFIVAPVLGSFITEPAAMTIGALLLENSFTPSTRARAEIRHARFVVRQHSVGGTFHAFRAPPV